MLLSRGLFAGVSSGRAPVGSPEADSGYVSRGGRFDRIARADLRGRGCASTTHAQVRFARVQFMPDPYRLRWVRSSAFALRFLPELRLDL